MPSASGPIEMPLARSQSRPWSTPRDGAVRLRRMGRDSPRMTQCRSSFTRRTRARRRSRSGPTASNPPTGGTAAGQPGLQCSTDPLCGGPGTVHTERGSTLSYASHLGAKPAGYLSALCGVGQVHRLHPRCHAPAPWFSDRRIPSSTKSSSLPTSSARKRSTRYPCSCRS